MNTKKVWAAITVAWSVVTASLWSQYSIDAYTVAGGGGSSVGGAYALSGTIGQPEPGRLSGGNYELVGGFWGFLAALQTPGAPRLSIEAQPGAIRVFWSSSTTGFTLEQSSAISGLWSQVGGPYTTNANNISFTVFGAGGNRFYRLRKQ